MKAKTITNVFIALALIMWVSYYCAVCYLDKRMKSIKAKVERNDSLLNNIDSSVSWIRPAAKPPVAQVDSLGNWEIRVSDDGYVWRALDTGIGGDTVPMVFYSDFVRKYHYNCYQLLRKPIYKIHFFFNGKPVK